jgi:type IV secretory pathway ATPase VirB11/archaellum biosynthesis ATPase
MTTGTFLDAKRNTIFIGGTGTGKTQVSIAMPGLMPWGRR